MAPKTDDLAAVNFNRLLPDSLDDNAYLDVDKKIINKFICIEKTFSMQQKYLCVFFFENLLFPTWMWKQKSGLSFCTKKEKKKNITIFESRRGLIILVFGSNCQTVNKKKKRNRVVSFYLLG